jgi:hypothetical protein
MEVTTLCHVETISGGVRISEIFTKQSPQSKCYDYFEHPVFLLRRDLWGKTAVKVKYIQQTPEGSAQFIRLSPCYVCYHASSKLQRFHAAQLCNTECCEPVRIEILSCIWEFPTSNLNSETLRLFVGLLISSVSKIVYQSRS